MEGLFLFGLIFLSPLCSGSIYHDPVNEAVVIDDVITLDPAVFLPPPEDEATTVRPEGYCRTKGSGDGDCLPISECFPYADVLRIGGSDFFAEILNSTEPCNSEESGYVCCPSYSYEKLPSKRPPILPQFPTSTPPSTTTTTASTNSSGVSEKSKRTCGTYIKSLDDLVVGGRVAGKGEFPWAVAITDGGRQFCGGSLFKSEWILTAAHCVQQLRNAQGIRVLIGGHNIGVNEANRETRSVTKILYHRGFTMQNLQNDVALLKLMKPVSFTSNIQPICLNEGEVNYSENVDLAGWGKQGNTQAPSKVLKTVNMPLIPMERCRQMYQGTNAPPMSKGMVCAGQRAPLKDACNGDSGGPLTQKVGDKAVQVGVVSWGIGCGEKPGVYTNVKEYIAWIKKNSQS